MTTQEVLDKLEKLIELKAVQWNPHRDWSHYSVVNESDLRQFIEEMRLAPQQSKGQEDAN